MEHLSWARSTQSRTRCTSASPATQMVGRSTISVIRIGLSSSGMRASASSVYEMRFADGRVAEIVQITDTARWAEALAPEP